MFALQRVAARPQQVPVPQYDLPAGVPALPISVPGPVPPVKQVLPSNFIPMSAVSFIIQVHKGSSLKLLLQRFEQENGRPNDSTPEGK
jgi:hypothetical protein